ncbi:MAG TPA: hypothetical protein VGW80_02155 [Solirubrobacterales bacterium]|jgi:hypothetical protein|nr:hypothetical protein [Solirubrobacterales bacterium]
MGGAKELLLPMPAAARHSAFRVLAGGLALALIASLLLLAVSASGAAPPRGGKAAHSKCKRLKRGHRKARAAGACRKRQRSKPKLQIESEFTGPAITEPVTASTSTAPGRTNPTKKKPAEPTPEPEPAPQPEPEVEISEPPVEPEAAAPAAEVPVAAPFRFFSPTSFWNSEPGAAAVLDPQSSSLAGTFTKEVEAEVAAGTGPWINTTDYSVPIVTVPAGQPTVRVQLTSSWSAPALQAAWEQVPIPPTAKPSQGTDGTLVVWQPSSDKLWEFWRASRSESGWQAAWGGAIQNVSKNRGAYDSEAWAGAKPWWGSSASSLSIAGGLITLEDLAHGSIDHALSIAIPNVRAGVYSSPAQRTDGKSTSSLSLPEGAHLRLDPSLDLGKLNLPPLTLMIARAAQRYGIFVRDRSRVVHFFAEDPTSLLTNPYLGKTGYFEGKTPAKLLSSFPWNRLQLLRMDLHSTS